MGVPRARTGCQTLPSNKGCGTQLTEDVVYELVATAHEELETGKDRVGMVEAILEVDPGGRADEAECRCIGE